jgi:segregation and condensation protein B
MELSTIIPHIEALVFASDKPLSTLELTEYVNNALGFIEDRANLDQVESAVEGIKEKYDSEFYAFELKQSGGGWQFLTKPEYHKTVALINGDKFIKKLSTAALETLAIIAYKQPITKSEIEAIRGVNCDYAVQKLLEKDLIIISGRNEDAVGKPLIYNTSKSFMDYFGINSADDLPKIREVLMEEFERATSVNDIMEEQAAFENDGMPALIKEEFEVETEEEVSIEEPAIEENEEPMADSEYLTIATEAESTEALSKEKEEETDNEERVEEVLATPEIVKEEIVHTGEIIEEEIITTAAYASGDIYDETVVEPKNDKKDEEA